MIDCETVLRFFARRQSTVCDAPSFKQREYRERKHQDDQRIKLKSCAPVELTQVNKRPCHPAAGTCEPRKGMEEAGDRQIWMGEWVKPKCEIANANRDEAQDERCAEQCNAITGIELAPRF